MQRPAKPSRERHDWQGDVASIRRLLDAAPFGIAVFDGRLRYRYVNEHLAELNGVAAEEHIGRRLEDIAPVALGLAREALAKLASGAKVVEHVLPPEIRQAPGLRQVWKARWFRVSMPPRRKPWLGVTVDGGTPAGVPQPKEAKDSGTRADEEFYRAVVEDLTEVVSRTLPDGTLTFVNEGYCRYFGKNRGEIVGSKWSPRATADDVPGNEAQLGTLSAANPVVVNEDRVCDRDGAVRVMQFANRGFFDATGRLLETQSVGRDVTAQKEAELALRESEERYRSLVQCSMDAVLLTAPDGRILSANDAACRMFGRTEQELVKLGRSEVVDPTDPSLAPGLQKRDRTGRFNGELTLIRKNGERFKAEVSSALFHDSRGQARTSMVIRDLSEMLAAKERIRAQRKALSRVERAARLAAMTSSVAHEISQPLTGIVSTALAARRLLSRPAPSLDELRECLDEILEDSRRAGHYIESVRRIVRRGDPSGRTLEINDVVRDAIRLILADTEASVVPVATRLGKAVPRVWADPIHIQHVLQNLIANAQRAMAGGDPGGKRVEVATAFDAVRRAAVVTVSDRGPGVPPDKLEWVFEAFHTTRPGGLGLGLATCRSLVEANGGRIWAAQRRGGGARFQFTIPVAEEPTA